MIIYNYTALQVLSNGMRYNTRDPADLGTVNIFIDLYKSFYDNRILIPGPFLNPKYS